LVVIAIIGIISTVVIVTLNGARNKGKDASAKASLASLHGATDLFYTKNNYHYGAGVGVAASAIQNTTADETTLCKSADIIKLASAAFTQTANPVNCSISDSGESFIIYGQLIGATSANDYFCVDSSAFSGSVDFTNSLTDITAELRCRP
jgi:type II secretory pathway pseudopilin PulG